MRVCGRIRVRKLRNGLRTFPRSSIRNDDFFQFREKVFGFFFGKKPQRNPFNFEIHLNDHCSLNCKSCFHFVPLAKPDSYYPLDEFERDIKRLCSLFDGKLAGFTSSAWGSSVPISASRRTNACVPCLCSSAGEAENGMEKPSHQERRIQPNSSLLRKHVRLLWLGESTLLKISCNQNKLISIVCAVSTWYDLRRPEKYPSG